MRAIRNTALTADEVPLPTAEWNEIEDFALTFDGYTAWASPDECAEVANARRNGSLKELRTCLFFEQRRWRHFGQAPNEEAMDYIRGLVKEIRNRVGAGDLS